ncbi:MAG TPA: ATPase, T2SS/T4P/T4SS family, partial [Phycisphaerae bacterium]|nr:ATPase, T2SS/T4P/T4SS family [Phycisphaerae bacterium]
METATAPETANPNMGLVQLKGDSIESVTEQLLSHAAAIGASDVFFCSNEQCVVAQVRHLGIVRPIAVMPVEQGRRVITLIKTRTLLDLAEKRRPQEGRWIFHHQGAGDATTYDLRVSTIPTAYGEDMALRLLDRTSKLFTLDSLGMTRSQRNTLGGLLDSPGGLILFTGPTGSGKTATMYTCLQRLNTGKRKINTIEDPIEYNIDGIRQSQVNPIIGLGFSELLRSVMRQAPDIIMLGEIRDQETASIAVRAANSGHLVL